MKSKESKPQPQTQQQPQLPKEAVSVRVPDPVYTTSATTGQLSNTLSFAHQMSMRCRGI